MTWQPWFKTNKFNNLTNNSIIQLIIQEEGSKNRDGTGDSVPVVFWEISAAECRDVVFLQHVVPFAWGGNLSTRHWKNCLPCCSLSACVLGTAARQAASANTKQALIEKVVTWGKALNFERKNTHKVMAFWRSQLTVLYPALNLGNRTFGFCVGMNICKNCLFRRNKCYKTHSWHLWKWCEFMHLGDSDISTLKELCVVASSYSC